MKRVFESCFLLLGIGDEKSTEPGEFDLLKFMVFCRGQLIIRGSETQAQYLPNDDAVLTMFNPSSRGSVIRLARS